MLRRHSAAEAVENGVGDGFVEMFLALWWEWCGVQRPRARPAFDPCKRRTRRPSPTTSCDGGIFLPVLGDAVLKRVGKMSERMFVMALEEEVHAMEVEEDEA